MTIGDSLAVYQNNLAIAKARIAELEHQLAVEKESFNTERQLLLSSLEKLDAANKCIAELEDKWLKEQAMCYSMVMVNERRWVACADDAPKQEGTQE